MTDTTALLVAIFEHIAATDDTERDPCAGMSAAQIERVCRRMWEAGEL